MAKTRATVVLFFLGVQCAILSVSPGAALAQQRSQSLGGYEIRVGGSFGTWGLPYAANLGGYLGFGKHLTSLVEVGANVLAGIAFGDGATGYVGGGPFIKLNLRARTWLNPFFEVGLHVLSYHNDVGAHERLFGFSPSVRLGAEFLVAKGAGIRLAVGGAGYFDRSRTTGGFTLGELGFVIHF